MLPNPQARNGRVTQPENSPEVWVFFAAVAGPPGSVHTELHEIGEAPNLLGPGSLAAKELPELIEIYRLLAFGL